MYVKAFTMVRAQAMNAYCFAMKRCAVAFIIAPAIMRIFVMELLHVFVAVSFGKYACSSYRGVNAIAFNDALVRNCFVYFKTVAIN